MPIDFPIAKPRQGHQKVCCDQVEHVPNNAMHAELATVPNTLYKITRANRVIAVVCL
jgi:hypothetical protein